MPLASSYSHTLLGAFWTILEIFLWVIWIWILIWIFIDIFRSHDLSGWAKALWFLFVLFIPLVGVLVYLILRRRLDARARGAAGATAGSEIPPVHPGGRGHADLGGPADQARR